LGGERGGALRVALCPTRDEKSRRSNLTNLRNLLPSADYLDGIVPPPVPPKYQNEFEAWRKKLLDDDKKAKRSKD